MRPSEQIRFWAHELAAMAGVTIDADFTPDRPYLADVGIASPKVGCSIAAFDDVGRVVLIKRADNGRWALPAVYDNKSLGGISPYQFYICCFRARITGGDALPSDETPEVVLADPDDLPENMSLLQRTMLADSLLRDAPAAYQ